MTADLPTATYRLQLREGVDFDAAAAFLPHLAALGVSHLYLSPIFTATAGSSHGYDITDPTRIDPALGGEAGFDRLAQAAGAAGIGIVLDLVPNHTAFSLENRWLVDVLRHGPNSAYAAHFDIDWGEGALVLPWLPATFEAMLANGEVRREGDSLIAGDLEVPLRPGVSSDDLSVLHEGQFWRLTHWSRERDAVTHRRFFNVTGLIGMRVESPRVFHDLHALPLRLVEQGKVQGLRLDHIDGLADPAGYLARLRAEVGDTPVWVEKILTDDETLPDWPVQGTTGYEAGAAIARVLGDAAGVARLRDAWLAQTGGPARFHDALAKAKGDVIRRDLAAELRRLITLAQRAIDPATGIDPGDEALREVFLALLTESPRYRTYFTPEGGSAPGDATLLAGVADRAAEGLRSRDILDLVARMVAEPATPREAAVQRRFQQVTGALQAKAHEDTAGFRWTPYLAACEVGADPDRPSADAAALQTWAQAQPGTGLLLTSSHDTKRSEDARMRLVALSHLPDDALALIDGAAALPEAAAVPANVRWYLVQSALAIWQADAPDLDDRLARHMEKALREADEITSWTHPDPQAEAAVLILASALLAAWRADPPAALARIAERGAALSLMQLALKLLLPGIPDIYRGSEGQDFALTDPDNRRPVNLASLAALYGAEGLDGAKARMTRSLLHLRRAHPGLLTQGAVEIAAPDADRLCLTRRDGAVRLTLTLSRSGRDLGGARGDLPPFLALDIAMPAKSRPIGRHPQNVMATA